MELLSSSINEDFKDNLESKTRSLYGKPYLYDASEKVLSNVLKKALYGTYDTMLKRAYDGNNKRRSISDEDKAIFKEEIITISKVLAKFFTDMDSIKYSVIKKNLALKSTEKYHGYPNKMTAYNSLQYYFKRFMILAW
jgi:hypothetical protein